MEKGRTILLILLLYPIENIENSKDMIVINSPLALLIHLKTQDFKNIQETMYKLMIIITITMLLVHFLLFNAFNSLSEVMLIVEMYLLDLSVEVLL